MYIIGREKFCTISTPQDTRAQTYIHEKKSGENILLHTYRGAKVCWMPIIFTCISVSRPCKTEPAPKNDLITYLTKGDAMNQPISSPPRFHCVLGLSTAEYKMLRDELLCPRMYFPVLNRTDVKRALCSALYFSALMPKLEHVVRIATSGLRAFESVKAKALMTKLFTSLETRDLYLFRDTPSKYPKVWTRNKARLASKVDSALMEIAATEFPEDAEVVRRCTACGAKWRKKRLPGVDKRLKPGPKTGKRKRLHKRKEKNA